MSSVSGISSYLNWQSPATGGSALVSPNSGAYTQ
jgi:hypothetical protein